MNGLVATLLLSSVAGAPPNPWPFDFDPEVSLAPDAIRRRLEDLGTNLPGLPAEQMAELSTGPVRLFFFTEMADALTRARSSDPGVAPSWPREPELCVRHDAFVLQPLLSDSSWACEQVEDLIAAQLEDCAKDCLQVEFPETYVFAHQPGYVDPLTVSSFDGLIALIGEALSHLDYPEHLLPDDLPAATRRIIAKLRYDTLTENLEARLTAYAETVSLLQTLPFCFDPTASTILLAQLGELTAELHAVRQNLDALHAEGLTRAAADRVAIAAIGRVRPELPHPALTDLERELVGFYVGGVYWRMRGAGLIAEASAGGLASLYYVERPFQELAELAGGADGDGVGAAILVQESWGWGDYFDMGQNPVGNDKYRDLVDMTDRGKFQVALVEPLLAGRGYDTRPLVAGGLQMGPCYYFAARELGSFRLGAELEAPYMQFLEGFTAIGEFCLGATLAVGLVRTLLAGKPDPSCVPDCLGRTCGPDGCGSACGVCEPADLCADGVCTCVPSCNGKLCGEDGCGGACGACDPGRVCTGGACGTCGEDGCGGACGTCAGEGSCVDGLCWLACPEPERAHVTEGCANTTDHVAWVWSTLLCAAGLSRRRRSKGAPRCAA